jgi:HK97 gp10 family phage protein
MINQEFRFRGSPELNVALLALPESVQVIALRKAADKTNSILLQAFRRNAPNFTGALIRSAKVKIVDYKGGKIVVQMVGPNKDYFETITSLKGKTRTIRPTKYLHLTELGTKERKTAKGKNRGKVIPRPFMKQARDQVETVINEIFENTLKEELRKINR